MVFTSRRKNGFFFERIIMSEYKDLVNIKQATEILNVSRQTVWHWIKAGAIRPVTVAGRDFIEMANVREIQDKLEKKAEIQKFFAGEK